MIIVDRKVDVPLEVQLHPSMKLNNIVSKFTIILVWNILFLKYLSCGKRLPRCRLEEIIDDLTSKYGIDSSDANHSTIRSRATRSNNVSVYRMQSGHISPICFKQHVLGVR